VELATPRRVAPRPSRPAGLFGELALVHLEQRVLRVMAPLAGLGIVTTSIAACAQPTGSNAAALSSLDQDCVLTAKLQCPFTCAQIDTTAACHADIGGTADTTCGADATGSCLTACGSDCKANCEAQASSACDATCNTQCDGNCRAVCAGALDVDQCQTACNSQCSDQCSSSCQSVSSDTCDGKCSASCSATCGVEAKIACELRASIDAQTSCTASLAAQCMADCATNITLSCVHSSTGAAVAAPPSGNDGGARFDSGPGAPGADGASPAVSDGDAGLPVRPRVSSF
jgi:hypothetical protein